MALTGFNYNNETSNLLNTFGQIYRQKIMGPCGGGFGGNDKPSQEYKV